MTGSCGSRSVISATGLNLGSSIGGMPSLGGPPEMISAKSTERFEKSVFQPSARHVPGDAVTPVMPATRSAAKSNAATERGTRHMAGRIIGSHMQPYRSHYPITVHQQFGRRPDGR